MALCHVEPQLSFEGANGFENIVILRDKSLLDRSDARYEFGKRSIVTVDRLQRGCGRPACGYELALLPLDSQGCGESITPAPGPSRCCAFEGDESLGQVIEPGRVGRHLAAGCFHGEPTQRVAYSGIIFRNVIQSPCTQSCSTRRPTCRKNWSLRTRMSCSAQPF